ncbi:MULTISPECIES: TetR/AcrR family transcriptional regulator [unclassified Rathayibacter]|uniref:TetR/AcrR family transcriptional regulator n=1 Tax=unclassified Rathayibacter TaxID=2609250 RepID=UPI0006FDBD51|nr:MULTISPECIES: TetR/AcrR family transcriptional regulator [unclassified Rathayibacter]KQP95978.1 TetR family transcriptional regulator [Rathayibacter sp. Leaf294]KQS07699.1 TetR family transcriptional regulator [Rathayibacter sp. Leaf185]
MTDRVKSTDVRRPRGYDASARQEKARAARARVVASAQELLEERGYVATTIAAVARRAGVSPESVFKGFGTKAALVKAVFDVAIAGDDEPVAVADRPETRRIIAEPDVRTKLRLYAEGGALRSERSARIQLAVRTGAAVDPTTDELWQRIQGERLAGTAGFAAHLVGTGQLRAGIDVDEIRDVLWTTVSIEVYDLVVLQRGWTRDAYVDWVTRTLIASICGGG